MRSCQAIPFWKFGRRFNPPPSRIGQTITPFSKYSKLKNQAIWLAEIFFGQNSRTRFFSEMQFLQDVRRTLACSYSRQNSVHQWPETPKTSILGHSGGLFGLYWPTFFLQKRATWLSFINGRLTFDKNWKESKVFITKSQKTQGQSLNYLRRLMYN